MEPLATSENQLNPFLGQRARFADSVDRGLVGPVGVWTFDFDMMPWSAVRPTLARLEQEGVSCLWIPELFGRETLAQTAMILAETERMVVANGIARIDWRSAKATAAGAMTLGDAYPGRQLLGLGVGPYPAGDAFELMGAYLDEMRAGSTSFPPPATPTPVILAAHGPKMAEFAAERTAGVHTYLVTVDHTAGIRKRIGESAFLAVEQAVVVGSDPGAAKAAARAHLALYLRTPYNVNKFRRLGFSDDDMAGGGSDRLLDATVAYGTAAVVAGRVREHQQAGADHVGVQFLGTDGAAGLCAAWADLRAALG